MAIITLDTPQIRDWVAEAGTIARRYFGKVDAQWKGLANPVTAADYEIEKLLAGRISAAFPDHGILGEQSALATLPRPPKSLPLRNQRL